VKTHIECPSGSNRSTAQAVVRAVGLGHRNLGLQPVVVSGKWTVRNVDYPCSINQACAGPARSVSGILMTKSRLIS
jgi:hypothetical protein